MRTTTSAVHVLHPSRPPVQVPSRGRRRNNMARILRSQDRRERFADADPDVEIVGIMIHDSGMTAGDLAKAVYEHSGHLWMPHYKTIENLMVGKTRRPQNQTLKWIALTLGWRRSWQRVQ